MTDPGGLARPTRPTPQDEPAPSAERIFEHRGKAFALRAAGDGGFELWMDGVCRKRREPGGDEPYYVWTNVELQWEEHHYIEARFWPSTGTLKVTINRELFYHQIITDA